jgi:hypothetical protein
MRTAGKFLLGLALAFALCAFAGRMARADGCLHSIEAVINWGNGKAYIFGYAPDDNKMSYVRYDIKADKADDGYPMYLNDETWPGLYLDHITAAINWGNGKAYFFGFTNDENDDNLYYVSYDIKTDKADDGYPMPVDDDTWPGLSMLPDISDVIDIGDGNIYFLGYNQDISYNQLGMTFSKSENKVLEAAPEEISSFGGNVLTNITAAANWSNDRFYLFGWNEGEDAQKYERFSVSGGGMDKGYPMVVDSKTWPGLGCDY